ncbi:hypothetical protein RGE_36950 [Rubrivivax gelatinosus IL144]|uniref:Uncharacterized protein n=1 Tax=Rubrivivax gelatinosus (strain NBRC 100245 / IL144) TaxID=983917 RepID=I0HVJ7_RUBGI|nr:hypothetical protein RGE_36950 [Rubrivivax gelatinosus IL144]
MPPSSLSLATPRGGRPPADRQSRSAAGSLIAWCLLVCTGSLTATFAPGSRDD